MQVRGSQQGGGEWNVLALLGKAVFPTTGNRDGEGVDYDQVGDGINLMRKAVASPCTHAPSAAQARGTVITTL